MNDEGKTKEQLIQELVRLRQQIAILHTSEPQIKGEKMAIRESEEKYRLMVDNAGEGVIVAQDGIVVYANPHVMEVTGYSLEELGSKPFVEFIHPEDREMVIEYHIKRLKGEQVAPVYSFRNIDKEGNLQWVEANVVMINWEGIPASLIFIKEITDRKNAEQALKESEAKFRNLVEKGNDGIVILQDGLLKFGNSKMTEISGFSVEEGLERPFIDFFSPESKELVMERYKKRMAGEEVPQRYEAVLLSKNGEMIPIEINASRIEYQGRPADMAIIRDISERKQAEENLKESEKRYRGLYESSIDGIVSTDMKGNILDCNQSLVTMLGYTKEELYDMKYQSLTPSKWHALLARILSEQVIPRGYTEEYEIEAFKKDGTTIAISCRSWLIKNKAGNPTGIWAIVRDITERKKLKEQLVNSEKKYRTLVEQSLQGLIILQDQRYVFSNHAFAEISGYTVAELLALSPEEVKETVYPEDQALVWGRMRDRLAGKSVSSRYECRGIRKDGAIRWLELLSNRIEYRGKPAVQVAITDITERKLLEQKLKDHTENLEKLVEERTVELKESESQYRTTIDSMGDMIHVVDSDLRFILFNKAFKQLNKELAMETDVIGKKLIEVFNFLPDNVLDEYYQVFDTGETLITEGSITLGDKEFITETRKIPIFSEGKVTQVVTVIRDITERKQAEERIKEYAENLKETEARYRGLYESSIDGIVSTDLKGNIVEVNEVVAYRLGYSTEELYDLAFYDIVPSKWHNKVLEIVLGKIFTRGYSDEFEIEALRKDGIIFPISVRMWLIKDKEDNPTGLWGIVRDITERKEAEKALKESERRLKEGQQVANFGNWDWNIETNELFWSDQIYKIFGLQPQEFGATYDAFMESVYPEDREFVKISVNDALWEKKPYDIDHRIVLPDGSVRFVHEKAKVFYDESGNPIRMLGTVQDITERKRAENALREGEKRFRELAELLPVTIYETDMELNVTYTNRTGLETFGYSQEDLDEGLNTLQIIAPEDHKRLKKDLARTLRGEDTGMNEYTALRKDGCNFPIIIHGKIIWDDDRNPVGLRGSVIDITERKQSEKALQKSEERYRQMADNIQDGLTIIENGKVVYVNDRACEIFGYPKGEYVTKSGWDLAAPEEKERLQRIIEKAHQEGVFPKELEYWIIRKDGSRRCVHNRYSYSRKDEIVTRFVITSDITERKKLDQMKSQFINVAAHELRTPLSALKAHVDLLKIKNERGYWQLPNEVTEKLNIIARNAARLAVLTNNLLDYTRLEAGTVKIKLESTSLDTIIVQVIEEVLPLVKKHKHKIDLITPEMLTPLDIDKELIHRVFSNLITNAIKYTPDGGKIDVKIVEDDLNLHITVKDTGIGIRKDDLEKIFQPFHVTDIPESARFQSEFERTGLGLAISREYVKMHGGSIWAESRLGEWSNFHVVLPKK